VHPVGLKIWYWAKLPHDKSLAPQFVSFGLQYKKQWLLCSHQVVLHAAKGMQKTHLNYIIINLKLSDDINQI